MNEEMKKLLKWLNKEKANSEIRFKEYEVQRNNTLTNLYIGQALAFFECIEKIKEICGSDAI